MAAMGNKILSYLIYYFLKLWTLTFRFVYYGEEHKEKAKEISKTGAYIASIWHHDAIGAIFGQVGTPHGVLISKSLDGELLATTIKKLGYIPVRGSSSRGGATARVQLAELLTKGIHLAITIDGPRGPRHVVKPGIVELARLTGSPIVPGSCSYSNFYLFKKSWDRFCLPLPFCKIVIQFAPPIVVPEKLSEKEFIKIQEDVRDALESNRKLAIQTMSQ
jgi:lysophospholipid acyltransferase (LPLAT)-like uncharacterized protein